MSDIKKGKGYISKSRKRRRQSKRSHATVSKTLKKRCAYRRKQAGTRVKKKANRNLTDIVSRRWLISYLSKWLSYTLEAVKEWRVNLIFSPYTLRRRRSRIVVIFTTNPYLHFPMRAIRLWNFWFQVLQNIMLILLTLCFTWRYKFCRIQRKPKKQRLYLSIISSLSVWSNW